MKNKFLAIWVIVILILTSFSAVNAVTIKKEKQRSSLDLSKNEDIKLSFFEISKDASALEISGIFANSKLSDYKYESLKAEQINFKTSDCNIHEREIGYYYFDIEGLKPYGSPGQPMLPMKTYTFELPKTAKIVDVIITNAKYQEIENRLRISPMSEPMFFENDKSSDDEHINNMVKQKVELYGSDSFFPGNILTYTTGENIHKQIVNIKVFPVQYIPLEGKLILITEAEINILYNTVEETKTVSSSSSSATNVIITHPNFYDQAVELKEFHDDQGVPTEVVKTTWIGINYKPSENPPYIGYKNPILKDWIKIKFYKYNLAKKIISYLRDTASHPNLEYVTLMGNGIHVPPSYYYCENTYGLGWVPTDFLYSSPDFDLVPNYYVGRLPVNTKKEAAHIVDKIKNWDSVDLFTNITIIGGQPFGTSYFLGELIPLQSVNKDYFEGSNIIKKFESSDEFNRASVIEALSGDSGIFYHFGHGNVHVFDTGVGYITPKDVYEIPATDRAPIIASSACSDGKYDTYMVFENSFVSFGQAVLNADAGGIAYIGGSRTNFEGSIFMLEEGRMKFLKERYIGAAMTYVMKGYSEDRGTLGNITAHALYDYQLNNNMSDALDLFSFFSFVLLGDPALEIPARPMGSSYDLPNSTVTSNIDYIKQDKNSSIPVNALGENVTIISDTNSPTVNIKLMDLDGQPFLINKVEKATVSDKVKYEFSRNSTGNYLIRIETEDGKEGWIYVITARIVDDDYDSTTPGYGKTCWSKIQDAVDSINTNSTKDELIYVFNGTYAENIVIERNLNVMGEDKHTTIIDGGGTGDVISLKNYSMTIQKFTITNSGKSETDSGISIKEGFVIAEIFYNIIDKNTNGIYLHPEVIGLSQVSSNTISNNTHGIIVKDYRLLSSSIVCMMIYFNTIKDNEYGIYLKNSGKFMGIIPSMILINTFKNNEYGIYLENCKKVKILLNNFIENDKHATFSKSTKNLFIANYWDDWIGLKFRNYLPIPKFIFGTRGKLGFRLRPALDLLPLSIPIELET